MTTFNTGNPLGSTDVYDRYDNSENLDNFSNGPLDAYQDRFGVSRQSLQGIRNASALVSLGDYAAGLNFTAYNQYMARDGFFYRPAPSSVPFTTTGTWTGGDEDLFSLFDPDDILRQDLANDADQSKGVALVGRAVAKLDANLQVLIPTDYPTLQQAFNDLSTLQCSQGVTITLMIEAGHQLLSGVNCFNGTYNHFVISSQDPVVQLAPSFSGRVVNSAYAWAPTLNCLIDADYRSNRGYSLLSSFGRVNIGCGVKNVEGEALWIYHSVCTANGSIWSGARTGGGIDGYAIRASRGSILSAADTDCRNCIAGQNGVVYVNRGSIANMQSINLSGCTGPKALYVHRGSKVNAHMITINGFTGTDQTGTVEGAISVGRVSEVDAIEATLTAINGKVGTVNEGGTLNLTCLVPVTDAGGKLYIGLDVRNSISRMSFSGEIDGFLDSVLCRGSMTFIGTAKNAGRNGLSLTDGATLSATSAVVQNCAGIGVLANYGSRVNIRSGSVTGSGVRDIDSSNGSFVTATLCSTTGGSGTPLLANTNAAAFNTLSQKGAIFN